MIGWGIIPRRKDTILFHTAKFWKETAERAIKTFAQSALAMISADAVSVIELDWEAIVGIGATAAVISVLTSVASAGSGPEGPSLV